MNSLRLSENIALLRKKAGITQDELAAFLGVTKASVSKWENEQSMPDILLLPEIATYFDVSVDELLGYEPQLSKEQIQKLYIELSECFANMPFEEAFAKSENLVKKYYSCYCFLLQMGILWLNHYMMAEEKERQTEILGKIQKLCEHITEHCRETEICSDAIGVKATADLLCGRAQEVIEGMEALLNPNRILNQSDGLLIQAYMMVGDREKADSFTQASMYLHMVILLGDGVNYFSMHMQEKEICEETISRLDKLIEAFHLDGLSLNVIAIYQYQAAVYYTMMGENEAAIKRLEKYAKTVTDLLNCGRLHGDSYFTKLDHWFEQLDLGPQMPRSKKLIIENARENLNNPIFAGLKQMKEYLAIERILEQI